MDNQSAGQLVADAPRPGEMLPSFDLPSSKGGTTGPRQFKSKRNLLLVFVHDGGCNLCRDLLLNVAEHYEAYREEEAEVLAVATMPESGVADLARALDLPFPLLADADGAVHHRYGAVAAAGLSGVAIYLADRYGEIQQRWLAQEGHLGLPGLDSLVDDFRFIGIQCPE